MKQLVPIVLIALFSGFSWSQDIRQASKARFYDELQGFHSWLLERGREAGSMQTLGYAVELYKHEQTGTWTY